MSSFDSVKRHLGQENAGTLPSVAMGIKWKWSYVLLLLILGAVFLVYISYKHGNDMRMRLSGLSRSEDNNWVNDHSIRKYSVWKAFQSEPQMKRVSICYVIFSN